MSVMLDVKAKSLAAEARIIRKHEERTNRCLHCDKWKRAHIEEVHPRPGASPGEPQNQWVLVCKEGGPRFKGARPADYELLHGHRTGPRVRGEARATHLARMFLRGKTYAEVEQSSRTQPDWVAVDRMLSRYASGKQMAHGVYITWKQEAKDRITLASKDAFRVARNRLAARKASRA